MRSIQPGKIRATICLIVAALGTQICLKATAIRSRDIPEIPHLCVCVVLCCLLAFHLQPMEIYVDDEAKLTLHGLVQVSNGSVIRWWLFYGSKFFPD